MAARAAELVFPLVPSRRGGALDLVGRTSRRRGSGDEIASSRPYRRGDAIRLVDWAASARLSTARASDEFVVRDHFAHDALRVVLVLDRSPSMALFPPDLPWLRKPDAVRAAASMILASGARARALIGFAEAGAGEPTVERPRRDAALLKAIEARVDSGEPRGPADSLDRALELLQRLGTVPPGSFVFVVSDFLPPPSAATLHSALTAGWDVVPVVVQDPVWERSFPDVAGVTLPLADPGDGGLALVRLGRRQARARRDGNELRTRRLEEALEALGLDGVTITSADPASIHRAFLAWAEGRITRARGLR